MGLLLPQPYELTDIRRRRGGASVHQGMHVRITALRVKGVLVGGRASFFVAWASASTVARQGSAPRQEAVRHEAHE